MSLDDNQPQWSQTPVNPQAPVGAEKHCKKCGTAMAKNAKVCPSCGAKEGMSTAVKILIALLALGLFISCSLVACTSLFVASVDSALKEAESAIDEAINDLDMTILDTDTDVGIIDIDVDDDADEKLDASVSGYQAIYDEYAQKLRDAAPTSSMTEMAELSAEGVTKMAEYMYKATGVDGQYQTYEEWAGKLMDVYMAEAR